MSNTSPSPIVADPPPPVFVDMLSPTAATWQRGIDLGPVEPRIRDLVIRGYGELLELARYLGNAAEMAYCVARIEELTEGAR